MALNEPRATGVGRWTRAAISSQVTLAVALALVAATLLTWLSARPGLRARLDLTAFKSNTLDPALTDLIEKLPERASIEAFFSPVDAPLNLVAAEAQGRMQELLHLVRTQFNDRVQVVIHDTSEVAKAAARMNELGLQNEDNVVVVQQGERKAVLHLLRDLARVNPGNPAMKIGPSLESFRGEEALGNALLRVSVQDLPRVWFTRGHGERELSEIDRADGLGRLRNALAADGLSIESWDSAKFPRIPDAVVAVAIVDARQPLQPAEFEALRAFVDRGGRLLTTATTATAAFEAGGGTEDLLRKYGIKTLSGFIAQVVPDATGALHAGVPECSTLYVDPIKGHDITDPLFRSGKRVTMPAVRAFERGTTPKNSLLADLLISQPRTTWRDIAGPRGEGDWRPGDQEEPGPFSVAVALRFPAPSADTAAQQGPGLEQAESRILALGSSDALCNATFERNLDFILNAFNWLASREQRLVIRPRVEQVRTLNVQDKSTVRWLSLVTCVVMPGLCALLGFVLAWTRRR